MPRSDFNRLTLGTRLASDLGRARQKCLSVLCGELAYVRMFAHLHNCYDGITLGTGMITFPGYLVSRAVLQFEYSKFLLGKETRKLNTSLLHQTFDKYFDNSSKTWPQSIANGESGTVFLAGIFPPEDDSGVGAD